MSDALAILGIYLTLGTLLATTFFSRLESWYGATKEMQLVWKSRTTSGMTADERAQHVDRYLRAQEAMPWKSAVLVSVLLAVLSIYAVKIGCEIQDPSIPLSYLWVPGAVCLTAAVSASLFLFIRGKRILDDVKSEMINAKMLTA